METTSSTRTLAHAAGAKGPLGALIRVHEVAATPQEFPLSEGGCTIGAMQGVDVVIDSRAVSRKHLEVELVAEGVRVTDLQSRNGTFYLGQRLERAVIALGSTLRLGDVQVSFEPLRSDLAQAPAYTEPEYRGLVGDSRSMRQLFGACKRLEGSLATVLIEGESGVGKELVARAIHDGSQVAKGPFIAVNCGALPRELAASELFGHVKGAFTGAGNKRLGAFEAARGGTLLLDEVAELDLELQPLLLRVLESRELRPVGSDQATPIDVRLLAATNRSLSDEVVAGRFREDLYYRLAVVRLQVPALRQRPEDIEPLARVLALQAGAELPGAIVEALKTRRFPGNVRELRNAIQAYAALGVLPSESQTRPAALESALSDFVDPSRTYGDQKEELLARFARAYLLAALDDSQGNHTRAAERAGLSRTYFSELLGKLGLTRK